MPAPMPPDLTDKIAELRKTKTCRQVADELGVSISTVSKYDDKPGPDLEAIVRAVLAQMGGVPGKPEVIEVAPPSKFRLMPGSRIVDLTGQQYERVAFLSDFHHPFQDDAAIDAAMKIVRDFRPGLVALMGDYFDCYSISDHDREPGRADTIQDEFDAARPTHAKVDDAAGDADVVFVDGNHEERIQRIQRRNPGLFKLRALELPLAAELPKRWQYFPNQTRIKLGSLSLLHGDLKGRGTNSKHAAAGMLSKLRTSSVFGHLHRHQVFLETGDDGTVRGGFANGHLSDVSRAHYITNPDWQQSVTLIEFNWSMTTFAVTPVLFINGAAIWRGTTYHGDATSPVPSIAN